MMNAANVVKLIRDNDTFRSGTQSTNINEAEQRIASHLIDLLQELSISDDYDIEAEESLEKINDDDPDLDLDYDDDYIQESRQENGEEEEQFDDGSLYTLEYMKKVVTYARPGIAFTTVQHEYPRLKDRKQLKRFREYVEKNGTRSHKIRRIEKFLLDKFLNARNEYLPVHDADIQRWAISQAKVESLPNFKASSKWLLNFKRRNNISSRKVTKFVSRREVVDQAQIKENAENFVVAVQKVIPKYSLTSVLNADQSSFNYEMASRRTLSHTEEKTTYVSVRSVNATTHSYTVMPIINAAGQLLSPVFLCLQEPTGRFPKEKRVFSANNVIATCSTSGKLNSSLVEYWIREVLDKVTSNRFLLLVDQWSPQTDLETYERNLTKDQVCKIMVIPGKTTATKQPCDVYFFRQWKELTKRVYYRVSLDQLNIDLRSRDAVIQVQSLVHNQLSSNLFQPMISFAWSTAGYIPRQHASFSNVIDICFSFTSDECSIRHCDESPFIRCSHCRVLLCFEHFFVSNHFH
jgi:hypothetical protein